VDNRHIPRTRRVYMSAVMILAVVNVPPAPSPATCYHTSEGARKPEVKGRTNRPTTSISMFLDNPHTSVPVARNPTAS